MQLVPVDLRLCQGKTLTPSKSHSPFVVLLQWLRIFPKNTPFYSLSFATPHFLISQNVILLTRKFRLLSLRILILQWRLFMLLLLLLFSSPSQSPWRWQCATLLPLLFPRKPCPQNKLFQFGFMGPLCKVQQV